MSRRPDSLHARIRDDIGARIRTGRWRPGHRLPTEAELMADYGCARMTVNRALAELVNAGLLVRRRKAGTFVADPPVQSAMLEIRDFAAEARAAHKRYTYELLSRAEKRLVPHEAGKIGATLGDEV
ncbi:MAG: GntR family transcriptional regulator, partial [Alphaproteobacteria bacterium]|nr:GntR family transcriptional regulator [Alphaproteobacteria bacterium]